MRFAREAGASPVFVVLGAHRERIEGAIDFGNAAIVVNEEWGEGLASSIRAGVKAAKGRGVKFGRKRKLTPQQIEHARELIDDNGEPRHHVADLLNVDRVTLYRALVETIH